MEKNMDLEKLEYLSCLKIESAHRQKIMQSIEGVLEMMHQIDKLELSQNQTSQNQLLSTKESSDIAKEMDTEFKSMVENKSELVSRHEIAEGLHLEQGYFLAPKVIEK